MLNTKNPDVVNDYGYYLKPHADTSLDVQQHEPHPYYDSKRRKRQQSFSQQVTDVCLGAFLAGTILFAIARLLYVGFNYLSALL